MRRRRSHGRPARVPRMIADDLSEGRHFDTIIVYDFTRFSRSASDLIRYRDRLERAGVRLLCATGPDES